MAVPNYERIIHQLKAKHPQAWKDAHTGNAHTEDFVRLVAAYLHELDPNVGLNGKRGNPRDISDDALNILDPLDGPGRTPDGKRCWVVDFIRNAGAPNAEVIWNPFDDPMASSGANVPPGAEPTPIPIPAPAPRLKPRQQFYDELREVNAFYKADDGLQRHGGMVLPDQQGRMVADVEALGAWGYDLMLGASVDDCKAKIRTSGEWKIKHGVGQ